MRTIVTYLLPLSLLACVSLSALTGELKDRSHLAVMEMKAGERTKLSAQKCALASLGGIRTAEKKAWKPGVVTVATARDIKDRVEEACKNNVDPTSGGSDSGSVPEDMGPLTPTNCHQN